MVTYKCMIVDDEPLALHVIGEHLSRFNQFTICATSTEPVEALGLIKVHKPDLLFLDIAMPGMTGLELIEMLQNKPEIILTTAYRDYAVEGFTLHVLDYLVKPIPFKRFVQAIEKFLEKKQYENSGTTASDSFLHIKADRKIIRLDPEDILYVEGVKDYVKIVTKHQHIITKVSIGNFLPELPAEKFVQAHKSFLVAKNKITAFSAHDIEIGSTILPVGRMYKDSFLQAMNAEKKT